MLSAVLYLANKQLQGNQPMPVTVSSSPSSSCLGLVGAGNVNFLHQINNLHLHVTPSYNRQFEIKDTTDQVFYGPVYYLGVN